MRASRDAFELVDRKLTSSSADSPLSRVLGAAVFGFLPLEVSVRCTCGREHRIRCSAVASLLQVSCPFCAGTSDATVVLLVQRNGLLSPYAGLLLLCPVSV